jgi:hypothetical protein
MFKPDERTKRISVKPGQFFAVEIKNLDALYQVSWEPARSQETGRGPGKGPKSREAAADKIDVSILHENKNGARQLIPVEQGVDAYIVKVEGPALRLWSPKNATTEAEVESRADSALKIKDPEQQKAAIRKIFEDKGLGTQADVRSTEFIVIVDGSPWHTTVAGAFLGSSLTDEVYTASPGGPGANPVLQRDRDHEDDGSLGLATMIHVYNDNKLKWGAISLGVGITTASDLALFPGLSLRFGDEAALTAGIAFGKIKTRPAGIHEGEPVLDVNALSQPPERTTSGWFLALSYAFIGGGEKNIADRFKVVEETKPADTSK